jgi:hypothetical protein
MKTAGRGVIRKSPREAIETVLLHAFLEEVKIREKSRGVKRKQSQATIDDLEFARGWLRGLPSSMGGSEPKR